MSLTSIKEDIKQSLRSAREAIIGRGGEISPTAGLKDLPEAIYKIPADASLAFQSDDSVAYRKIVPATAEEYAQIAKIGGMTYKCPVTNYLKITGTISDQLNEAITINSDGSITIDSTDFDTSIKGSVELDFEATAGDYYFFATGDDISDGVTVTIFSEFIDENGNQDGIINTLGSQVKGDVGFDSLIVDFGEGDGGYGYGTPLTFRLWLAKTTEGIFEGLRDIRVTELVSEGANLLDISQALNKNLVDNGDGTYTFTRTTDDWTGRFSADINTHISAGVPVSIKATSLSSTAVSIGFYDADGNSAGDTVSTNGTLWLRTFNKDVKTMKMFLQSATAVGTYAKFSELQINYGSTAAPYKPYRADAVDTFTISAELRAFLEDKGYGRGVKGYPNYIDFERGIFRQNTYRKVFDGTENWILSGTAQTNLKRMGLTLSPKSIAVANAATAYLICNSYEAVSGGKTWENTSGASITGGETLHIYDENYQTVDTWKAHLAKLYANGNPLIVEYALAEPIEVDISAYLKDDIVFLQVEGGGTITAVNEYEHDAPSTINYIAKVGG